LLAAVVSIQKKENIIMKRIAVFKENQFKDEALSTFLVHESPYMKVMNFNLKAGQSLPIHSHEIEGEVSIVVLEGSGLFLAKEGQTLPAEYGDVLVSDISEPHGIQAKTDMRVLAVIAPPI
jgi:quercetin dioxygenase-like cupin family protein